MTSLRRIYRVAVGTAGIEVLGMGLGYASQVALARWLGASGFGVFAWVTNLALLLAVPAQLGLSMLMLRELSPSRIAAAPALARGLLRRAYQLAIGVAVAGVLVVCVIDRSLPYASPYRGALLIGLAALPFLVVSALHMGRARAFDHVVAVKTMADIGRPALLLVAVGGLLELGRPPSTGLALAIFTATAAVVAIAQYRRLDRIRPAALRAQPPVFATRHWLGTAAPFALVALIDVGMRQTDLLMIGLYRPPADVGLYAVASRAATLVTLSLTAINMLAAPVYAELHQQGRYAAMQQTAARLAHAMFWPALVVVALLAVFGDRLLALFGPAFVGAYTPMLVLAGGALVNVGAGSVGYLANMTGHQWIAVRIQGAAVVLNIVLNAVLIPTQGLMGAAIATATSVAVANIALHGVIARRIGVRPAILFARLSGR